MSDKIHVLQHPLVNARMSHLRQTSTSAKEFREVRLAPDLMLVHRMRVIRRTDRAFMILA